MKNILIIIPAHNEENRISNTLLAYHDYFNVVPQCTVHYLVVLNGCTDNTLEVLEGLQLVVKNLSMLDLPKAGKGYAITQGLKKGLQGHYQLIGFADADMSTTAPAYHNLITSLDDASDGVIASRYIKGAKVHPPRPLIKRWGSKYIYEPLVHLFLDLKYADLQCGEKIFKAHVLEKVAPYLQEEQWAFDIELLYLCKKAGFTIKEVPTVWEDKVGSKLKIFRSGMRMLKSLFTIREQHKNLFK